MKRPDITCNLAYYMLYLYHIFGKKQNLNKSVNFTIHEWICNVSAVPNPTQYTNKLKYKVKTTNRNWLVFSKIVEICRLCLSEVRRNLAAISRLAQAKSPGELEEALLLLEGSLTGSCVEEAKETDSSYSAQERTIARTI